MNEVSAIKEEHSGGGRTNIAIPIFILSIAAILISYFCLGFSEITVILIIAFLIMVITIVAIRFASYANTGRLLGFVLITPFVASIIMNISFGAGLLPPIAMRQALIRGVAFYSGVALFVVFVYALTSRTLSIQMSIDRVFTFWIFWGFISMLIGMFNGFTIAYIASDTYKWMVLPLAYFSIKGLVIYRKVNTERVLNIFIAIGGIATFIVGSIIILRFLASRKVSIFGTGGVDILFYIFLIASISEKNEPTKKRILYLLMLLFVTLVGIMTLKRGIWFALMLAFVLSWILNPKIRTIDSVKYSIILLVIGTLLLMFAPTEIIQSVTYRWEYTFAFQQSKQEYDPSTEARFIEAESAIREMEMRGGNLNYLVGMGTGAEYLTPIIGREGSRPGYDHQIHMTYVDILFREGLVGILLLCALILTISKKYFEVRRLYKSNMVREDDFKTVMLIYIAFMVLLFQIFSGLGFIGDITWGILLGVFGAVITKVKRTCLGIESLEKCVPHPVSWTQLWHKSRRR
jgi:hypothetical protein